MTIRPIKTRMEAIKKLPPPKSTKNVKVSVEYHLDGIKT